jgi:hypothetical protein
MIKPLFILAFAAITARGALAADVDSAIVFAVDTSASVDPATADMQREGHAAAICTPEFIATIARGPKGCIAIAYVEWASPGQMRTVVPWTSICERKDAQIAAAAISSQGDRGYGCHAYCATSISNAIDVSGELLDQYNGHADRKIIDISASGTNNDGPPVETSRLRAVAKGYTINAITVPFVENGVMQVLTEYFARSVIGGPGAFVMEANTASDYTSALRRKLLNEISLSVGPLWSGPPSTYVASGAPRMRSEWKNTDDLPRCASPGTSCRINLAAE